MRNYAYAYAYVHCECVSYKRARCGFGKVQGGSLRSIVLFFSAKEV